MACIASANAQQIDSTRAPKVWLSADRSLLSSTSWSDIGIFAHHAVSATAVSTPSTFNLINFNKALVFDGVDDHFTIPFSLEKTSELSVLAVFQSSDTTERGVWGTLNPSARTIILTTRRAIGPDTITDKYGKYERVTALNSVVQTWEKTPTVVSPASSVILGSAALDQPYKKFRGALAELIIFNHALDFLERVQYESYLAIKYGTGLKQGNFVSSKQQVLWRGEENAAYGNNIAGIGRDDHFHLNQKQSGSAYDSGLVMMSMGPIAATNQANSGIIENGHFVLWGDNGGTLNTVAGTGEDTLISVLQRKWLVTVTTENRMTSPKPNLYIDASQLPADPLGYWLAIDRSGQGDFSIDNLEYISPTRIENGKLLFENMRWDFDGSGKDNFTLVRKRKLLVVARKVSDPLCSNETGGQVKIEVVAGEPSFHFTLSQQDGDINRNWRTSELSTRQYDLTEGEYELTVDDNADETLVRRFTLTQPDKLIVDLGPDQPYDMTTPIRLDASTTIPTQESVTYHWENSFGFQSNTSAIDVSEPGVYRATVTRTSDGCAFMDEVAITGSDTERIAVYPTIIQSSESYNIGVSLPRTSSVTINIFNARGMMTENLNGTNNSEYLFTTTVKDPGVYMIVIKTSTGIETRKIIAY